MAAGDFAAAPRVDPTLVSGIRGPADMTSARVIVEMDKTIHMYAPKASPFTTLTNRARKKRQVHNEKFEYLWKDEEPREITLTGAALVADTTLDVNTTDDDKCVTGDMLINTRTQEVVRVTSVTTNVITVKRGLSAAGEVDMAASDVLYMIGRAAEDGADFGDMVSTKDEAEYNYIQEFETVWGRTWRLDQTDLYGGADAETEELAQSIRHKRDIELSAFFGARSRFAGVSKYVTSTGGLNYFVTSNRWNLGDTVPTKQSWTRFLEDAMRWGDGGYLASGSPEGATKYLFCSSHWMTMFEDWYRSQIVYEPLAKNLGIVPGQIATTQGRVMLVKCPSFDARFRDFAFLVDLNHINYVYFGKYDTKLYKDLQDNDSKTYKNAYHTACGWQINLEAAHAVCYGLKLS
jgi:hypothetical protein